MSNTPKYIKFLPEERVQIHKWYYSHNSIRGVRNLFSINYPCRPIPCNATIRNIINRFKAKPVVKTRPARPSRKNKPYVLTEELKLNILCQLEENPRMPSLEIANIYGISDSSVLKVMSQYNYETNRRRKKIRIRKRARQEVKAKDETLIEMPLLNINKQIYYEEDEKSGVSVWLPTPSYTSEIKSEVKNENDEMDIGNEVIQMPVQMDIKDDTQIPLINKEGNFEKEKKNKLYGKVYKLSDYMKKYTKKLPYKCKKCNTIFMQDSSVSHKHLYKNEPNYECESCKDIPSQCFGHNNI